MWAMVMGQGGLDSATSAISPPSVAAAAHRPPPLIVRVGGEGGAEDPQLHPDQSGLGAATGGRELGCQGRL